MKLYAIAINKNDALLLDMDDAPILFKEYNDAWAVCENSERVVPVVLSARPGKGRPVWVITSGPVIPTNFYLAPMVFATKRRAMREAAGAETLGLEATVSKWVLSIVDAHSELGAYTPLQRQLRSAYEPRLTPVSKSKQVRAAGSSSYDAAGLRRTS